MTQLKLYALDEEDLAVVSAHVQDAVVRVGDLVRLPREKRFVVPMNRFVWENRPRFFVKVNERRRSALTFDRVLKVSLSGIDRAKEGTILSLLALQFTPTEPPAGMVELTFSGGAAIRLDVECIELRLADLGGAWAATSRPAHED